MQKLSLNQKVDINFCFYFDRYGMKLLYFLATVVIVYHQRAVLMCDINDGNIGLEDRCNLRCHFIYILLPDPFDLAIIRHVLFA